MIAAMMTALAASLLMGAVLFYESRRRVQVEAARSAGNHARKAHNLKQALSIMPRGYLPESGISRILTDIQQATDVMILSRLEPFPAQGKAIQAEAEGWFQDLEKNSMCGPGTANISTQKQVEIVREVAKYLHEYISRQLQKDAGYCEAPGDVLAALEFSCTRVVSDFYNNLARSHMESGDEYKARLALERAADILKPWREKLPWADRAYDDFLKRARQLADAEPKITGTEKQWENWRDAGEWKKKAAYD